MSDQKHLEALGYDQKLVRGYSALSVTSQSMGVMALAPSVASVLTYNLSAGGAGITWGWFVPCLFILSLGVSLSEFASAMPTSGGFYWWTYHLAPWRLKRPLSYLCGWADTFGLISGAGSITYGAAEQLLTAVSLGMGSEWTGPTKYETYGVYAAMCILGGVAASIPSRYMSKLALGSLIVNIASALVLLIALPVGHHYSKHLEFNSAGWVFGNTDNLLEWQYGWTFLLSWMAPLWAISNFDSSIHLTEETRNASRSTPIAVLTSIAACATGGWVLLIVIAFVINPNVAMVLDTPIGLPLGAIVTRSLGTRWAIALMSLFSAMQFWMAIGCLIGGSRETWSFARDGGLPWSHTLTKVVGDGIPLCAIIFNTVIALLVGLLILVNTTAALAIFNMAITSLYLAWCLPVTLRALHFDKRSFSPGPFYLGHMGSQINCSIAAIYGLFVVCVLTLMPETRNVDASTMNYSVLVVGVVLLGAMIYYVAWGHKNYTGPPQAFDEATAIVGEIVESESVFTKKAA